ncbi:glycosyltransferase family 2 protein [Pedobacter hiemivivus]|uniref:Glycosyltransferase family 2 protein n=1 Tax=Pedobacter hiemivivus TaxID=2530454 RepID=A0A4R0N9J3_9SPHI|nr:glycosyltransferase family 2 protein [Pedobacter hiemivivus]TCC96237.1 glycosyltransferase family 2 protein [Pedobacter hiemivivus]
MLLTIGIPVYNGEKYIKETIESILICDFDWEEVEVIVSDNASTDNTLNYVREYSKVRIIEHEENVGYDKNLNRVFQYANGKYVWTIGADDLVVNYQLENLIKMLKDPNDFGVIFVGGKDTCEETYCTFDQAELFLEGTNFRSGFFPNNVIAKNIWLSCEAEQFFTSGWIHYAMVLQALRKKKSALTKNQYVIESPRANEIKTWNKNGSGITVGLKLVEVFQVMQHWGYDEKFIRKIKGIIKNSYPRVIIVAKLRGFEVSKSILDSFIRLYGEFPLFWILDIWFLLLPSFIYRIAAKVLRFANLLK